MEKDYIKKGISRRKFFSKIGTMLGLYMSGTEYSILAKDKRETGKNNKNLKTIHIRAVSSDFERERLIRPFGFKGGYQTEKWQLASLLESGVSNMEIGLCSQSILWSDANIFASHSESGGNALMYLMLERALQEIKGKNFKNPIELLEKLLPDIYEYGREITQNKNLRKTFVLNSLVSLDNAAWLLYARENDIKSFDEMIPQSYRSALSYKHKRIAGIPLMTYGVSVNEVRKAVEDGYFFLKIKIGQPGTQKEMLDKDKKRIEEIHKAVGDKKTPHTEDGKIKYYLDANGRYQSKETLKRLLDHAEKISALEQIAVVEEPFPEEYEADVSELGVRVSADESAHTDKDAERRIQMGYSAIALKAIAKTLSMTLKIIKVAHQKGIPCFCADATANPILVDWNKNVAARLAPFPELGLGLLESNGYQNYVNWDKMLSYHPCAGASWIIPKNGIFNLNVDFYKKSGGIFMKSEHYLNLFHRKKS